MNEENKASVLMALIVMVGITATFIVPFWIVQSHETARACMMTNHAPAECARWGKP